jgi:hypothetical protein
VPKIEEKIQNLMDKYLRMVPSEKEVAKKLRRKVRHLLL